MRISDWSSDVCSSDLRQILGTGLGAHLAHRRRTRAYEDQARAFDRFGKVGVFRQKTVARMNRLSTGFQRHRNDGLATQIRVRRRRAADAMRRIRPRSEEHTSELQSIMRIPYAVFSL